MIRYSLRCSKDHDFDSWFASSAAFDSLNKGKMVSCPNCGDTDVEKTLMAPQVRTAPSDAPRPMALSGPPSDPTSQAIAKLRAIVEANSEDVGNSFVSEARAIHLGEKPARSIYGQAKPDEARKLIDDGIPVAPLPFIPSRKSN